MNDYVSFLCTLLNIKIPKVYFKVNDKVYDLKHKPVNKELFQVKDTSICTSYPKENVICVNLNTSIDSSLVYIYLAHEIRHLYQYACVYKKNQKVFSIDERSISIYLYITNYSTMKPFISCYFLILFSIFLKIWAVPRGARSNFFTL